MNGERETMIVNEGKRDVCKCVSMLVSHTNVHLDKTLSTNTTLEIFVLSSRISSRSLHYIYSRLRILEGDKFQHLFHVSVD